MSEFPLSPFQTAEVRGLLDVRQDENELVAWGTLHGQTLTVTDRIEAVDDLRRRADYLVDEGATSTAQGARNPGTAAARHLRTLADQIEAS